MGDIYSIETPESVAVGYDIAGVGSRFLAILIDTAIQVAVLLALLIVAIVTGTNFDGAGAVAAVALGVLLINVVLLGYYIFFESIWNGQTPGKRVIRLRVIKTSGYPITPFAALIRNILRIVDFLPGLYAVGVITMFVNRQSRRLGDLVAGTIVIKEGRGGSFASLSTLSSTPSESYTPRTPAPPAWSGDTPAPPYAAPRWPSASTPDSGPVPGAAPLLVSAQVERLTREDEALVRDFLSRRAALPDGRRDALARQIAAVVHAHIGGDSPLHGDARTTIEPYLEMVLAARHAIRD